MCSSDLILVKSLMPVTKALVTYERGRVLEYKVSEQGGNATHIEIPIEQGMIPNFFLSVVAHAGREGERPPLIFYGETAINVEPDAKRLTVSVEADRKGQGEAPPVYRPGEKVTVKVKTAGPDGKPMPAHVIVSVADESVLRLLGYELPDLVKKFYYRRPSGVMTSSSMVSLKAGDAGKAGKKRRVFKDTAHFVADLATGKDGEASFSFALPDDLTTWVIEALAATEPRTRAAFDEEKKAALQRTPEGQSALGANLALSDGNFVGGARGKIMTTLPLVLRAALPRFAAWGDRLVGRVIANNRGDAPVSGEIEVSASGSAALKGGDSPKKISMEIPAGEESSYPVEIDVASEGDRFALSAQARSKSGEDLDGLEISVPVKDRFSPEVVATSGMTEGTEEQVIDLPGDVEESLGGLGIRLRAALALAAAPGLKALIDFPYGCSEQKSASLAALLMAREMTEALGEAWFDSLAPVSREAAAGLSSLDEKKGYLDERIKVLLSELVENFMNYDGGLRYWPESSGASYFATVQSLWAMTRAKAQGFAVDEAAMGRMRGYVRKGVVPPRREGVRELSLDEKAFGLWALSLGGAVEAGVGDELPGRMEEMSVTGASYLLMAMKNMGRKTEASKAAAFVLSQARQEPRHTSWPASKFLWSSALKNTALAATALFSNDPSDPNVPRALAFVLNRKRADRGEGTQDNLYSAWLVADFAKAKGEGEADFRASVASGEESLAEAAFDEKNLLVDVLKDIPMKELSRLDMPAKISIGKRGEGTLYYDMVLKYYLPPDETPTREEGIIVSREYYALNDAAERKPLKEFKAGENYRGHITVIAPQELNYVVVEERLPAGFEPIDVTLATSSRAAAVAAGEVPANLEPVSYWAERSMSYDDVVRMDDFGMSWNFRHQEIRDDAIIWSDEIVPAGVYHIRYPVRATTAGEYLMPGTTAFEFYEPEIFGRGVGRKIRIKE